METAYMRSMKTYGSVFVLVASVVFATRLWSQTQSQSETIVLPISPTKSDRPSSWRISKSKDLGQGVLTWVQSREAQGGFPSNPSLNARRGGAPEVVSAVEFKVLRIPEERRKAIGFTGAKDPSFHAVIILRDQQGQLVEVVVGSPRDQDDGKTLEVYSIGPLLDERSEKRSLPAKQRGLMTWPPRSRVATDAGKPVLIPYPYAINQIFYQHGDDPDTAVFESLVTGRVYRGLDSVLSEVDSFWKKK
jgi:hypothetical protein